MTICREWTLVKTQGTVALAEPLRCRSWTCEICAPERRKRLIAQAIAGAPNTFITLTVNPKHGTSPTHRARLLVAAWRHIRRWAGSEAAQIDPFQLDDWRANPHWRSRPGRPRDILGGEHPDNGTVPFLAVFERTKRGEPHLHILARTEWLPQAWLSRCTASLLGAPVCWIERITDVGKMASYIAKYCAKEPAQFDTVKRYWASQDYEVEPYEDDRIDPDRPATFEVVKLSVQDWMDARAGDGWMVQASPQGAVAWDMRQPQKGEAVYSAVRAPPFEGGAPGRSGQASASEARSGPPS